MAIATHLSFFAFFSILMRGSLEASNGQVGPIQGPQTSFKGMFDPARFVSNKKLQDMMNYSKKLKNNAFGKRGPFASQKISKTADGKMAGITAAPDTADERPNRWKEGPPVNTVPSLFLMKTSSLMSESCEVAFFNKTIRSKRCKPKTVQLKLCRGRCQSFTVPSEHEPLQFCSHCLPDKWRYVAVILECPDRPRGYKLKIMRTFESCKCTSAKKCF